MGGRGASSGANGGAGGSGASTNGKAIAKMREAIERPTTRKDFIDKLNVIAQMGEAGYTTEVSTSDWENYGKSRTYLKINSYNESTGRLHHSIDYGYYDNKAGTYVKSKAHDLGRESIYTLSGNKADSNEIDNAIKKYLRKK